MLRFQLHRNIISLLFHLALLLVLLPALPGDALNLKTFVEQSTGQQKDRLLRRILQETNSSPPSLQQLADSNSRLHLMESTQSFLGSETEAQSPKDAAEPPASGFRAFLDRNSRLRQSLQDFFQHMDKDGDGRVTHLVDTVLSFDVQNKGYLEHQDFEHAPVFLNLLETEPSLMELLLNPDVESEVKRAKLRDAFARARSEAEIEPSASRSFAEAEAEILPKGTGLNVGLGALKGGVAGLASGGGLEGAVKGALGGAARGIADSVLPPQHRFPIPTRDPARRPPANVPDSPFQPVNISALPPRNVGGRLRDDLFKTARYGIPSEANELCVMCQYSVQMIRRMLYEHVRSIDPSILVGVSRTLPEDINRIPEHPRDTGDTEDRGENGMDSDDPNSTSDQVPGQQEQQQQGDEPFDAYDSHLRVNDREEEGERSGVPIFPEFPATVDAMQPPPVAEIDKAVSIAMNQPGARGLVRILTEDVFTDLCSPNNIPELFYPTCRALWSVSRQIDHSIFFRFPSSLTCSEVGLCGAGTYFQSNFAVHMPDESRRLNARRGLCGLAGGNHDLQDTMCRGAMILEPAVPRPRPQTGARAGVSGSLQTSIAGIPISAAWKTSKDKPFGLFTEKESSATRAGDLVQAGLAEVNAAVEDVESRILPRYAAPGAVDDII